MKLKYILSIIAISSITFSMEESWMAGFKKMPAEQSPFQKIRPGEMPKPRRMAPSVSEVEPIMMRIAGVPGISDATTKVQARLQDNEKLLKMIQSGQLKGYRRNFLAESIGNLDEATNQLNNFKQQIDSKITNFNIQLRTATPNQQRDIKQQISFLQSEKRGIDNLLNNISGQRNELKSELVRITAPAMPVPQELQAIHGGIPITAEMPKPHRVAPPVPVFEPIMARIDDIPGFSKEKADIEEKIKANERTLKTIQAGGFMGNRRAMLNLGIGYLDDSTNQINALKQQIDSKITDFNNQLQFAKPAQQADLKQQISSLQKSRRIADNLLNDISNQKKKLQDEFVKINATHMQFK